MQIRRTHFEAECTARPVDTPQVVVRQAPAEEEVEQIALVSSGVLRFRKERFNLPGDRGRASDGAKSVPQAVRKTQRMGVDPVVPPEQLICPFARASDTCSLGDSS